MNETPNHDLRLQRLIERVLIADDIQTASDEDLEARLDATDAEPFTNADVDRILAATRERIAKADQSRCDQRNGTPITHHSSSARRPDWAFAAVVASLACVVAALILDVRPRPATELIDLGQRRLRSSDSAARRRNRLRAGHGLRRESGCPRRRWSGSALARRSPRRRASGVA